VLDALESLAGGARAWRGQVELLAEVRRVLRPAGRLLLGVANRFGYGRPRAEARECLRSYWGYRRLLRAAGFGAISFHAPLPSQREPLWIIPLQEASPLRFFVESLFTAHDLGAKLEERGLGGAYALARRLWRLAERVHLTALARYVVPSYLIVAERQASVASATSPVSA
jgi:hypothetical protein